MHFEEILSIKTEKRLTYGDAARMLGVSELTLRVANMPSLAWTACWISV